MARAHERTAALPVGEELEALARHCHHLQVDASELLAELIDVHFDVIPRGRRALAR